MGLEVRTKRFLISIRAVEADASDSGKVEVVESEKKTKKKVLG